jgi:hypothetical protein
MKQCGGDEGQERKGKLSRERELNSHRATGESEREIFRKQTLPTFESMEIFNSNNAKILRISMNLRRDC